MANLTKKQRFWKEHLDASESYEGSTADYAREHDLDPKKLYVFKSAIAKKERAIGSAAFTQVKIASAMPATDFGAITITLPNRVVLTVSDLQAPGLLERLARL